MRERGGPTTQSGILYQNSVAALYLGRLCDETARPDSDRVVRVRVEAPEDVDDIVVYYADEHVVYVQAKENIRENHTAWRGAWRDFAAQYAAGHFVRGRDILRLHIGEPHEEHLELQSLCDRARTSEGPGEWRDRLTAVQQRLVSRVETLLGPDLPGEEDALRSFFAHVEVEIWPLLQVERDLVRTFMPATNQLPIVLFRLLRDRVGGEARRRGSFEARALRESLDREGGVEFRVPPDTDLLRAAVQAAGALLRQHKHTLGHTGIHLRRAAADDLASWALEPVGEHPVAMLLDQAGTGKTVVVRDVLALLEERGATVLAIKADQQLSGVLSPEELQERLGLPEPVERVCGRLAALGRVVVIVDQIDALSLSLARDQRTLDVVLDLVARLRMIPGVSIVLSCRTFDRKTDPRLHRIEVGREFRLALLDEAEVSGVVGSLGIAWETLTLATRELLRTPLHLDLFATLVQAMDGVPARLQGIGSLQQLYGVLWEEVVLRPDATGPPAERERVLRLVTDRMARQQRTSVPRSTLHGAEAAGLERAVDRLASAGILVGSPTEWTFLHQTFFDYCYARFFVEDGAPLARTVLASDQGLFARSQLMQVLMFLRGSGDPAYLRELGSLLGADRLRLHLRDLLLRWFGALPDPSDGEWLLARRLLADPAACPRVLGAMGGNPGWFARLRGGLLGELLAGDPTFVGDVVVPYLASLVNVAQPEIAEIVEPWLEREWPWPERFRFVLLRVSVWEPAGIGLHERWLRSLRLEEMRGLYEIDDIARADPAAGARLVRTVLDRVLDEFLAREPEERWSWRYGLPRDLEVLNGSGTAQAIDILSKAAPAVFLEQLVPWLERAMASAGEPVADLVADHHASDPLSSGWHDTVGVVHHQLMRGLVRALAEVAQAEPTRFQALSERLAASPYMTPQRLLANAYCEVAPKLAQEAVRFLVTDPRRLDLGENEAFETRKLIEAIAPHLPDGALQELEEVVLSQTGKIRSFYGGGHALRWRGADQLNLLRSFPRAQLSERGLRILGELERKFPGLVASDRPGTMRGGWVGPPIGQPAIEKMSDNAWLGAMAKYAHGVEHRDHLRGGAPQLARVLIEQVKANPQRFFALAQRTPHDLDNEYAEAFIQGLAESDCPPEWVFALVRRFADREGRELRRITALSLERTVPRAGGLPPDLLELLGGWIRQPPGEDELGRFAQEQDLHTAFINTVRGGALETVMRGLAADGGEAALDARWGWVEFAADDPSVVLRSGAILELVYLIQEDQDRAIDLFERLVEGFPALRESSSFHEFLYWAAFGRFARLGRYVEEVMNTASQESRQRGAELAVLAQISPRGLESDEAREIALRLAEQAVTGAAEWRRGAARIYAHNIADGPTDLCVAGLRRLLDDDEEEVRREVAWMVHHLRGEHLAGLRDFLLELAGSRSAMTHLHDLAEYLWEHGPIYPLWALSMVDAILDNRHSEEGRGGYGGGEELVRLVLRIYNDPMADEALRDRVMDTFDHLMDRFAYHAWTALDEWDRR
ncbi:MAG TPA: hypothetical protein VHG28_20755 [Longimicrobiaceae bacterium]|nr:hypothetical protein [Longimicrobiaceae bacterium]